MKRIRSKLNNSQGVSMIIALVFMLICLFVGGVVLTSATVNAGRMRHIERDRVFIDHRSAAMLLADKLKTDDGKTLKLEIEKTGHAEVNVTLKPNGKVEAPPETLPKAGKLTRFVLSHDPKELSVFQRLVVEAAMKKADPMDPKKPTVPVYYEKDGKQVKAADFKYMTETDLGKYYIHGNLDASVVPSPESIPPFDIYCYHGKEDRDNFDFFFKFNWPGEYKPNWIPQRPAMWNEEVKRLPKIDVRMYSDSPVEKILPPVEKIVKTTNFVNRDNKAVMYIDVTSVTSVVWQGPKVMKGDAK